MSRNNHKRITKFVKQQVIERDGFRCWICGVMVDPELVTPHPRSLTIDHVVPKSKGGTSVLANLAVAHKICNESKTDLMPWQYFNLPEGVLYREGQQTAILLLTESDDDLITIVNKLVHTRNKSLRKAMNNIIDYLNRE